MVIYTMARKHCTFKNPFVSFTHAIRHCGLFLKSKSKDRFVANPNYDPNCENPVAIYCVHGTADRSESFNLLAQRLKDDIPSNIKGFHLVTFNHRARGISNSEFVAQLKTKIETNNDKRIILMGHSRGGLQVADIGETLAEEGNVTVDGIVPIAAPFKGSYLAIKPISSISKSVNEMRQGSDYLNNLNARIERSNLYYRIFGAKCDRVVTNDSYLPTSLPLNRQTTLYDRHGHLSILSSWRLRDQLKAFFYELYPDMKSAGKLADVCEARLPNF
jgi:pimeloyl-ACP methyl ester carboxylesterase